jgi:hypothetical protein
MLDYRLIIPEIPMFPCHIKKACYLLLILSALSLVSACGQKGDLYLPDEQEQQFSSTFFSPIA